MRTAVLQPATNLQAILLAGPTAVGKSEIALLLAEKVGGEIISVDSMQVYRGMDIGTAKPSAQERGRVPHHLIDVVELTEPFNAAQFMKLAREAVEQIQRRGHVPILCGGTGLYFKAFLEGLGGAPPEDAALRAKLATVPLPELLAELAERDPELYRTIDRKNPRRVLRAIEVIRLTGKPFSQQRARSSAECGIGTTQGTDPSGSVRSAECGRSSAERAFGLSRSLEDLHRRIDARVEEMFRRGLVAETVELLKRGLAENKTAMQALGYRQVVEHLRGERCLPETIVLVKLRTRQFAKRQMTWFRRQARLEWMEVGPNETAGAIVKRLVEIERGTGNLLT
ncbi:MAG: tRNA dimethylallyltransferase [Verrucomicrobiota bacterium]